MQVMLVRNEAEGPLVFQDEGPPRQALEWYGKGDPQGRDYQEAPISLASNTNFRKCLSRGLLAIEEAPAEVLDEIERSLQSPLMRRQAEARQAQIADQQRATADAMESGKTNDLIQVGCVGPAARGLGDCGSPVAVREAALADHPPLCSTHQGMPSTMFFSTQGEKIDPTTGKPEVVWGRAGMAPRDIQPV